MKKGILLVCSILFLTSCSSNLSEKEAKTIISKLYPTNCTIKSSGINSSVRFWWGQENKKAKKRNVIMSNLVKKGILKVRKTSNNWIRFDDYDYELTRKFKSKNGNNIPLTSNEFVNIIGISQEKNKALVRYKMKSVPTIFWDDLNIFGKNRCYATEWEEEITLVKFDTGWKIEK